MWIPAVLGVRVGLLPSILLSLGTLFQGPSTPQALDGYPDLYEASIVELQAGLETGAFTSVDLVNAYLARIDEVNHRGPKLNAVIETNPSALLQAASLDEERRMNGKRSMLHGIPILVKDNIATNHSEGMNTTAGSLALLGSIVPRDATVIAKLRQAGAIPLGKTSLSEWSHARGVLPAGFSARGGQGTNPYLLNADPSGSSSGSGISAAIGLAACSLGTETDGSITMPSSKNNLVGIKPTVGLTSRAGVIPISSHQDTVGPMCRSVEDAAILLSAMAGRDSLDNYTSSQPDTVPDYRQALDPTALKGARLGVPRSFIGADAAILQRFNATIEILKELGAHVVDPAELPDAEEVRQSDNETIVARTDLKFDVAKYISELLYVPSGVKNLSDLIQFNIDHADEELIPPYYDDQSTFIAAEKAEKNSSYFAAIAFDYDLGRTRGIDGALQKYNLDALILPTETNYTTTIAAIAGYPIVTVPMGFQPENITAVEGRPTILTGPGMPFGLAFLGTAFSESKLIGYAYAYEQKTHTRLKRLAYAEAIPKTQLQDVIAN